MIVRLALKLNWVLNYLYVGTVLFGILKLRIHGRVCLYCVCFQVLHIYKEKWNFIALGTAYKFII